MTPCSTLGAWPRPDIALGCDRRQDPSDHSEVRDQRAVVGHREAPRCVRWPDPCVAEPRMWSICSRGAGAGNVRSTPAASSRSVAAPLGGPMLRSPSSTVGCGLRRQRCHQPPQLTAVPRAQEGQVRRDHVEPTVRPVDLRHDGRRGARRAPRSATGGPRKRCGTRTGAPGRRTTRQPSTSYRLRNAMPYAGESGGSAPVAADQSAPGSTRQGSHEPVMRGTHRLGRHGGQVRVLRPRLVAVDLLQPQQIGVQRTDRAAEAVLVHPVVGRGPAAEDVERRDPHGPT